MAYLAVFFIDIIRPSVQLQYFCDMNSDSIINLFLTFKSPGHKFLKQALAVLGLTPNDFFLGHMLKP